jgi:hypothetical protein
MDMDYAHGVITVFAVEVARWLKRRREFAAVAAQRPMAGAAPGEPSPAARGAGVGGAAAATAATGAERGGAGQDDEPQDLPGRRAAPAVGVAPGTGGPMGMAGSRVALGRGAGGHGLGRGVSGLEAQQRSIRLGSMAAAGGLGPAHSPAAPAVGPGAAPAAGSGAQAGRSAASGTGGSGSAGVSRASTAGQGGAELAAALGSPAQQQHSGSGRSRNASVVPGSRGAPRPPSGASVAAGPAPSDVSGAAALASLAARHHSSAPALQRPGARRVRRSAAPLGGANGHADGNGAEEAPGAAAENGHALRRGGEGLVLVVPPPGSPQGQPRGVTVGPGLAITVAANGNGNGTHASGEASGSEPAAPLSSAGARGSSREH